MLQIDEAKALTEISYLCAVASALWSVSEWKSLQESKEALNKENHSISNLHQILTREIKLLFFLLLLLINLHLIIIKKSGFSFKYNGQLPKTPKIIIESNFQLLK